MLQKNNQILEYPGLRANLIWGIKDFSDIEYQKNNWCFPPRRDAFWHAIVEPINCIFDIPFLKYPTKQIGVTIRNKKELEALINFGKCLKRFLNESQPNQIDEFYLDSVLWQDVVQKAKIAYDVLMENEDLGELDYQEEVRIPPTVKEGSCNLQDGYFAMYYFIEAQNQKRWNSALFSLEDFLWVHDNETLEEKSSWKIWIEQVEKNNIKINKHKEKIGKDDNIRLIDGYRTMNFFLQHIAKTSSNPFIQELSNQVQKDLKHMQESDPIEDSDVWKDWIGFYIKARGKVIKSICLQNWRTPLFP
jgi:hypothetical protein